MARKRRCTRRRVDGFTLIELLVVTTLIALMAMMVTPVFYRSFGNAQADHAVRDLVAHMRAAQELAVNGAAEHRVYFDAHENAYWIAAGRTDRKGNTVYVPIERMLADPIALPDRLAFDDFEARAGEARDEYYLSFFPSGTCDIGEVTLENTRDRSEDYTIVTTGTEVRVYFPEDRRP